MYGKSEREINDSKTYGIGPLLRYYIPNNREIKPFFEVSYTYNKTKNNIIHRFLQNLPLIIFLLG